MVTSTFVGVDALLERALAACEAAVARSQTELIPKIDEPHDTRALEASIDAKTPVLAGRTVTGKVTAGEGLPRGYAVIVHQRPAIHHDDGSAFYLSRPLIAHAPRHRQILRAAAREVF